MLIVTVACFARDGCWLVALLGGLVRCWWFGLVLRLICVMILCGWISIVIDFDFAVVLIALCD